MQLIVTYFLIRVAAIMKKVIISMKKVNYDTSS